LKRYGNKKKSVYKIAVQRVQKLKLLCAQVQNAQDERRGGEVGIQKVLQALQKAHRAQRIQTLVQT
jgi:hypothetical protein